MNHHTAVQQGASKVEGTGLNPTVNQFCMYVIWKCHLLLSAQISFPQKHYRAQRGGGGLFHKIMYMMWIEAMDRIFRCSDIFKVSHKRQTRELEENHYSPLENMLPYHAATVVWKMKKKHMQRGDVCFYACQTAIQIPIFILLWT